MYIYTKENLNLINNLINNQKIKNNIIDEFENKCINDKQIANTFNYYCITSKSINKQSTSHINNLMNILNPMNITI